MPEESRRARAVPVYAALRTLGCSGLARLVDRCCAHARRFAAGLRAAGYEVLNDVVLQSSRRPPGGPAESPMSDRPMRARILTVPGLPPVRALICYEAIFPQLVRKFAADGAGVLVNISDDGWYGNSSAPFQHFEMARFRAIENGRFLLRSTNNGITAIVDPYGRVEKKISRERVGVLTGRFRYIQRKTFYTRHGDLFAWSSVGITAGLLISLGFGLIGKPAVNG